MKKGTIKLCNAITSISVICSDLEELEDIAHILDPLVDAQSYLLRRIVGELEQCDIDNIIKQAKSNDENSIANAFSYLFDVDMSPEEASMFFSELIITKD